jgi:type I restriction enzyme S subunit
MNSETPLVSLRDAGVKLIDCVHKTPAAADHGFPYIAIPQLSEGRVDVDSARRISEQDMLEWNVKCNPQEDDIILSRRCNPGVTAVIPKGFRGSLGQNLVLLRATDTNLLTPKYLRWVTRGREWWNEVDRFINVGAVFESLKCADIPEFAIPVPSIPEQRAIAHILGTLDDKIELNRKTNETLEAMAKALFKSWFVDFDPVRAKAEDRPTGLPAEISDLFPDSFEDSELGEIPSGWVVANVGEVTDLVTKGTTPTSIGGGFSSEGIPFYKVESISDEGHIIPSKCAFIDEQSDALLARSRIQEGDILFSIAGTIGRVAQMTSFDIPANTNQALAIARPNRGRISSSLLFYFLRERSRIDLALSRTVQSVQANFSLSELRSIPLALPKKSSRIALEDILDTTRKKVSSNQRNSFTVAAVRDALLPKLISGEIRIPDAEKMLQEVGV